MNDIDSIKSRIAKRRQNNFSEYSQSRSAVLVDVVREKRKRPKKQRKSWLYKISTSFLLLLSLTIGSLIYMRSDEDGKFLKQFNINVNFSKINNFVGKYLDNIFNFNLFGSGSGKTAQVDASSIYVHSSGDLYQSGTNKVISIDKGTVVYAKYIYGVATVIIEHDSGFMATYTNIEDFLVESLDRVERGDTIGVCLDYVTIYFSKDSQKLSYEEVLLLLK